jgi:hypothetical protein
MDPNKKSADKQDERIHLNDYNRKDESAALHEHPDESIKDVDRNLNEQMGGTDSTVTSEPNHVE